MPFKTPEHKLEWTRQWRKKNPAKMKASGKSWRSRNKRHLQNYDFKRNYVDERDAMLVAQGNSCACCGATSPGARRGWVIDHDHVTGLVRGIVCVPCNVKLGMLGDTAAAVLKESLKFLTYLKATPDDYLPILEGRVRHALAQPAQ